MGPDLLVSYHDNDHYNSVRNKMHSPEPSSIKILPILMNDGQTTCTTATTIQINNNETETLHRVESPEIECVTASLSELPLSDDGDNDKPDEEAATEIKATKYVNPKRSAPCPCGSGFRYKKCCLAKQKHAIRVERLKAKKQDEEDDLSSDTEEEKERSPEMFRVVAI